MLPPVGIPLAVVVVTVPDPPKPGPGPTEKLMLTTFVPLLKFAITRLQAPKAAAATARAVGAPLPKTLPKLSVSAAPPVVVLARFVQLIVDKRHRVSSGSQNALRKSDGRTDRE